MSDRRSTSWVLIWPLLSLLLLSPLLAGESSEIEFESVARQAREAMQANQAARALELFQRGTSLNPTWEEGWWYQGVIHYEAERLEEAQTGFRSVLALNPQLGPAWAMMGVCQAKAGRYYRAFESIERGFAEGLRGNKALRFSTNYFKGALLTRFERFEEAFLILYSLARDHPNNPTIAKALGLCILRLPFMPAETPDEIEDLVMKAGRAFAHAALEEVSEARRLFAELLEEYSSTRNVHYAYGQFLAVRNDEAAIEMFRKELEISPNHIEARLQLAWQHLNQGRPDEALPFAQQAAEREPDNRSANYVMGRIYLRQSQIEESIAQLEKAVEAFPSSPQVHQFLGRAYFQNGQQEKAEETLKTARELRRTQLENEESRIQSGTP